MKKLLCFLISIILLISLVSCGNSGAGINDPISSYDGIVKYAIGALKTEWKDIYSKYDTDGHFEIKNTRVIEIKDNHLVMTRRSEDYEIVLPFNPKCKEEGKYCVKGIGNLHLDVETTNLVINPANLLVEYNMILDGETESKFKYTIKYEESK